MHAHCRSEEFSLELIEYGDQQLERQTTPSLANGDGTAEEAEPTVSLKDRTPEQLADGIPRYQEIEDKVKQHNLDGAWQDVINKNMVKH